MVYDQQMIEMRDGSSNVLLQAYYAEGDQGGSLREYIDDIVALKLEHGYPVVSQAEAE